MSQFGQPHAAASLFGQARGYVGSTSYGALDRRAARHAGIRRAARRVREGASGRAQALPHRLERRLRHRGQRRRARSRPPRRSSCSPPTPPRAASAKSRASTPTSREEIDRLVKARARPTRSSRPKCSRASTSVFAFRPLRRARHRPRRRARDRGAVPSSSASRSPTAASIRRSCSTRSRRCRGRCAGGVRDIARAIEQQVTDGLIEARAQGATRIRLVSTGTATTVIALDPRPADELPVRTTGAQRRPRCASPQSANRWSGPCSPRASAVPDGSRSICGAQAAASAASPNSR